ncbi:sensor histidine kinase [Actinoplanes teichomyceticus]|uniref:histidine kinase n=1 Tax=Actinoplanes teichomyceticus TaxID=1867 RepID=A0A561VCP4_ACTTI|nr:ATP-binding protein [Actinoplanes teichomyceticus]TWG09373.1 signal transduction histidine kinase [Actinoplanes teichomyceticus]GIF17210.1 hypothetical protein Ate01nite_72420 [Actinoplanes teichomyceticus]
MEVRGLPAPVPDAAGPGDAGYRAPFAPDGPAERTASSFAAVLARVAGAPTALVHRTEDGERLTLTGAAGVPAGWARVGHPPARSTLAGLVLMHQHPIISADIAEDPRVPRYAPALELGVRAYVGFPIRGDRQQIAGVCTVVDYRPRQWSPRELAAVDEAARAYAVFVAEQQRADTQRRYLDTLLQSMRIGVAACDEHGRLVFDNESIRRLMGTTLVGTSVREWARRGGPLTDVAGRPLEPDDLPLLRALRGESVRDAGILITTPGRPTRTTSSDAEPILGADGRRLGAVLTVHDVTERRRAERFRDVDRAVTEVLAHADSVRQAGPQVLAAVCEGFGWPYAELWLVDQDADTLVPAARYRAPGTAGDPPGEPGPHDAVTGAAWRTGRPVWAGETPGSPATPLRTSLAVPATSGDRVLAVLSFGAGAVDDPADPLIDLLAGVGAHIAEFVERRRADELSLALTHSKQEYLALIGHEMRTPLTSISAYVELLRESDPASVVDELPGMLDVLSRNSASLRAIVDQLLDLAALDSGHARMAREPVDLTATVRAAVAAVQPVATAAGVTVALDLRADAVVPGDAGRLRQVVDELIGNAVKHTFGTGLVTVLLERPDPAAVELTVADTGVGIPAAEQDRLFERFYRSEHTRQHRIPGNGLGLAVSRAVVEAHHGSIRLLPAPGPGTRITVRLPAGALPDRPAGQGHTAGSAPS